MNSSETLEQLNHKLREIHHLKDAAALLSWDQETYMPAGGGEARADQIATLQTLAHKGLTSPEIEDLLTTWIDPETGEGHSQYALLDARTQALLRETWRDFNRARKLPSSFVNRLERECSLAQQAWTEAKGKNDFATFFPHLRTIVSLKHEETQHVGYSESPYNALLDTYEPGLTVTQIKPLFSRMREKLVPLLDNIRQAPIQPNDALLHQPFDPDKQMTFCRMVLTRMGYDFQKGRLDLSAHPFTTSFHPTDVRVTTRVFEKDLPSCLFSCIHEGGHGLYEQGLPSDDHGTPLGEPISLGMHESQSRLWENCVGRSLSFWSYFFPHLQQTFPKQLSHTSLEEFYRAINTVKPSFIRAEADEVTYNLHIMLRFEIELDLLERRIEVEDLPTCWNEKMKDYLGIVPDRNSDGVLQDVHWSLGAFGYFPTYTLGNLYAAMLYDQANVDLPDFQSRIAAGELTALKNWLQAKVHRWGRQFTSEELIHQITGQSLNAEPFLQYVEEKIKTVYR